MLSVEQEMIAAGYQDEFQYARNWRTGAVAASQSRLAGVEDKYGASFLTIHRADVQNILAAQLPATSVHKGLACTGVESDGERAAATFSDGSSVEGDIIIGAAGIHSAVRASLFGRQEPRFTGCICYRGIADYSALKGMPLTAGLNAWWGPAGHVVYYRVRKGKLMNFVAHCDSEAWTEESWTRECSREEVMGAFAQWSPDLLNLLGRCERYYKWALYDRDPLPEWGKRRVSLLGDSVHPMLPYLGQGAAMALEDACILARLLADHDGSPETILRQYEAIRRPRAARVQLASRERAKTYHLKSPLARIWRDFNIALRKRFSTDKSTLQADWVYRYNVAETPLA